MSYVKNFDYTGSEQTFTAPYAGYYKLEVWGAQGGGQTDVVESNGSHNTTRGGTGGYAIGVISLTKTSQSYVYVGGYGGDSTERNVGGAGGYNGGGAGGIPYTEDYPNNFTGAGGGGGATHIATTNRGELKNYIGSRTDVLIVAGGGGGATFCSLNDLKGSGGGFAGQSTAPTYDSAVTAGAITVEGGTQTTGFAFGLGQDGGNGLSSSQSSDANGNSLAMCNMEGNGGGGGGWYGGYAYHFTSPAINYSARNGAGGSGYIGSSNLISGGGITKHMTCYSCTTSTATATRTNSNTNVSASATADYSKTGNGYARITYLGVSI